jgi:hypothetical protein
MALVLGTLPLFVAAAAALGLALLVFARGPGRDTNRAFALYLLMVGASTLADAVASLLTIDAKSGALLELTPLARTWWAFLATTSLGVCAPLFHLLAVYPRSASRSRWLTRTTPAVVGAVLLMLGVTLFPRAFYGTDPSAYLSDAPLAPLGSVLFLATTVATLFLLRGHPKAEVREAKVLLFLGLMLGFIYVVARDAVYPPTYQTLVDSRGYALAQDILYLLSWPLACVAVVGLVRFQRQGSDAARLGLWLAGLSALCGMLDSLILVSDGRYEWSYLLYSIWSLVPVGLLAYAVLRNQLPGLEGRVRTGLTRAALAGIFLGVFFVVSQIAQNFLQGYGVLTGGIAAGLLLFALSPLQGAAQRLAAATIRGMGGAPTRPAMANKAAATAYRNALALALGDGQMTRAKERRLAEVADALGLTHAQEQSLRHEAEQGHKPNA